MHMKRSSGNFHKFRVILRWTVFCIVLGSSAYSYLYLGWQEPVVEAFDASAQIATETGPEEGLVLLLAKAMKSLLGYI